MAPFHHAWACFQCRKSFKKTIWPSYNSSSQPVVICPECGGQMKYMGRHFAAPKQSDLRGWKETREWLRTREQPETATMTWQEILQNERVSSFEKAQAKKARQLTRAAWLKKLKRKRYLRNLEKWTQQQTSELELHNNQQK